jgi:FdhD protein
VPVTVDPHVAVCSIERLQAGRPAEQRDDEVAVEEPLEIRVDGEALAVTMRSPGHDEELAVGFLAGEGLIAGPQDVAGVGPTEDFEGNAVDVRTAGGMRRDPGKRSFHLTSSCGICGKGALEDVRLNAPEPSATRRPVPQRLVPGAPEELRAGQRAFGRTGGLHATGIFDLGGRLLCLREDVGRHNAMDKAVGALLLEGRHPLTGAFACLSGRAGFELVQKAAMADMAGVVAVGAPTSLAVDLARERGMLLCGFVRQDSFNVYAGVDSLK